MPRTKNISTEEKILAAAKTIFIEKGMDGARMQDIADKAGINKALLHYYFKNKEKLFEVIFKEGAEKLFSKINSILNSDFPLFEKIRLFSTEYAEIISQNPYLPLFVLNEMNKQPHSFLENIFGKNQPTFENLVNQIDKEIKKGTIKPVSPVNLVINMISLSIFPFVAKPVFQRIMNLDPLQFSTIMDQRKTMNAEFIIASIKK